MERTENEYQKILLKQLRVIASGKQDMMVGKKDYFNKKWKICKLIDLLNHVHL